MEEPQPPEEESEEVVNAWSTEVEDILERLRVNSVTLSEYHRKNFYDYKSYSKYFRIPIILLSILNSTAAVGLVNVGVEQIIVSGITCLIGMIISMISSVELYLNIEKAMDNEMQQSKDFYTLAIDIFKTLKLKRPDRGENGKEYMQKKFSLYVKYKEVSDLMKRKLKHDALAKVPGLYELPAVPSPTNSVEEDAYRHFPFNTSIIFDRFSLRNSADRV